MQMRVFGRTGIRLSLLGFGCGAVGGLMVRGDAADQERTVARALAAGVNYFDTAVQYGDGASEQNLGRVLQTPQTAPCRRRHQSSAAGTGDETQIADAVTQSLDGEPHAPAARSCRYLPPAQFHHRRPAAARRSASAKCSNEVVPAFETLAPARQDALSRPHGRWRHRGAASGDQLARFRQRAGRLQHAQSVRRRSAAGKLSGPGLRATVRSHARRPAPASIGIRVLAGGALSRLGRAPSDCQPAAGTDRVGR